MRAHFTSSTPQRPSHAMPAAPPGLRRALLVGMAVCAGLALGGLAVAIFTPATAVFSFLIWGVFTILWAAIAAALLVRPRTLDEVWHETRRLPLVLQGAAWFLFLPVMAGLWVWASAWPLLLRLVLVVGLGAWTVFFLFPRSP